MTCSLMPYRQKWMMGFRRLPGGVCAPLIPKAPHRGNLDCRLLVPPCSPYVFLGKECDHVDPIVD